jgi:hypothetical protein
LTKAPGATELTVPASGLLILTGWVDWPDGSTFLAKSQEGVPLTPPSLELQRPDGKWKRLYDDIGLPAGKPKSIVVELPRGLTLPARLRIVTNSPVHWTAAALAQPAPATARLTYAAPSAASLRFRGFSRVRIHPERLEPERFFYNAPLTTSMWNPTPGAYTRYGGVDALIESADDAFVIMGSGDELALRFDARSFPPVPSGHTRSFLLAVDGWARIETPTRLTRKPSSRCRFAT